MPLIHRLRIGALALPLLLGGRAWAGDPPDKGRCADAYESTQRLDKSGKLVEALDEAAVCANDACPALLRSECIAWLSPLRARQSSLVVEARDGAGAELVDVRVRVDGALVQSTLEGRAFFLNPGRHALRFERDAQSQTLDVVVREGEQGRRVVVRFAEPSAPARSAEHAAVPSSPTLGWVFGGVAIVALGSFATFGLAGKSLDGKLESECAPRCASDRVDSVRTMYTIADVSLGVGIVSAAIATWFFVKQAR